MSKSKAFWVPALIWIALTSAVFADFEKKFQSALRAAWGDPIPLASVEPTQQKNLLSLLLEKMNQKKLKVSRGDVFVFQAPKRLGFSVNGRMYISTALLEKFKQPIFAAYVLFHLQAHDLRGHLRKAAKENQQEGWLEQWVRGEKHFEKPQELEADRFSYHALAYLGFNLDELLPFFSSDTYTLASSQLGFKTRINFLRHVRSRDLQSSGKQYALRKEFVPELLQPEPLDTRAYSAFKQGLFVSGIGIIAGLASRNTSVFDGAAVGFSLGFLGGMFLNINLVEF